MTKIIEPPVQPKREPSRPTQVRRSVRRLEGRAKVDGSAEYIHNLTLPGMLYGKIARSSIPHGKIVKIDATAALALEGVHAVITGDDIRRALIWTGCLYAADNCHPPCRYSASAAS